MKICRRLVDVKLGPQIIGLSRSIVTAAPAPVGQISLSIMDGLEQEELIEEMLQQFFQLGSLYKFEW